MNNKCIKVFMKDKKKAYFTVGIILVIAAVILIKLFYNFKAYELEYDVKPLSLKNKTLSVNLKIKRNAFFGSRNLSFVRGAIKLQNVKCIDNKNKKVEFTSKDGIINISKISFGTKYIDLSYNVIIGDVGKHGCRGQMYEDLITFEGESVFVLPIDTMDSNIYGNKGTLKKILIKYNVPSEWETVVPFTVRNNKRLSLINNPRWVDLYDIRKSSYTFGELKKEEHKTEKGKYILYIDSKAEEYYTKDAINGIDSLFNYYSDLFGYELDDFSLVLLRKDNRKETYILGGSSRKNQATTFDSNNARDWQLMSHRLFHSYFENKVEISNFNTPSQLWFYEGLVTYYENIAAGNLPNNIKINTEINMSTYFADIFQRYIYMKLKDPNNFSLIPMEEMKYSNSLGKIEFLHYTQAPLIVKYIEDDVFNQNKEKDNLLKYIISHNADKDKLKIESILKNVLGQKYEEVSKKYLFGKEIIPLWYLQSEKRNDENYTLEQLNNFEYNMYTWFKEENRYYLSDMLSNTNIDKISIIADKKNIHFEQIEIEQSVEKMSPTVYKLLKQYALRASVCEVDIKDKHAREKLLYDINNVCKWQSFGEKQINN